eukprot:358808-Chlamydomonas_euryale.AAC.2
MVRDENLWCARRICGARGESVVNEENLWCARRICGARGESVVRNRNAIRSLVTQLGRAAHRAACVHLRVGGGSACSTARYAACLGHAACSTARYAACLGHAACSTACVLCVLG